jgi:hypothetical protein
MMARDSSTDLQAYVSSRLVLVILLQLCPALAGPVSWLDWSNMLLHLPKHKSVAAPDGTGLLH